MVMFKITKTYRIFSMVLGVFALLATLQSVVQCPYAELIQIIVDGYAKLVAGVFDYIDPALQYVAFKFFKFELNLNEIWRHVLIFLGIYFSAETRSDFSRIPARPINTVVNILVGVLVTFSTAIFVGVEHDQIEQIQWDTLLLSPFGFVVFQIGPTILTTTFSRPPYQNWRESFAYNFRGTFVPYLAFYILSVVTTLMIIKYTQDSKWSVASIPIFMLMASAWWLRKGLYLAVNDRSSNETIFDRFFRAGSSMTALNIIMILTITSILAISASCWT